MEITLDDTLGAAFLGLIGATLLQGISTLQAFIYFTRYPDDHRLHKMAVGCLWFLDTAILVFSIHGTYFYLITNYGRLESLLGIVWSFKVQNLLTDIMVPMVQILYTIRLWKLATRRNKIVPIIVTIALGIATAIALLCAVKVWELPSFLAISATSWVVYAPFTAASVFDVLVSGSLCFYLANGKASFRSTNSTIQILMFWVISTGVLTSICSLAVLVLFSTMQNNLIYVGVDFLLTKLYLNSFLAMLNARKYIRDRHERTLPSLNSRITPPAAVSIVITENKHRQEDDGIALSPMNRYSKANIDVASRAI